MFFTIDPSLFDDNEVDTTYLNKIWSICTDQHIFYLSDSDALEAIEKSNWYKNLGYTDKMIWQESFTKSVQMEDKSNKVKVSIGYTHTAFEAFHYLSSPLKIILENSRNDGYFLKAIFRCFRQDTKTIVKHIENRWIQFVMGGGSSIRQAIETDMESYSPGKFPKEKNEYLRCFVLLDSDKEHPTAPLKSGTDNLIHFLEENRISYHLLEKREMENYIPDIAFRDVTENRTFIDAYLRLTVKQKDYFDLEHGFKDVNFSTLPQELQNFFSTVSVQDRTIFRQSNMKHFTNSGQKDFKTECPKLFNLKHVDKAALVARTKHQESPDELKIIIQKIRELI